MYEKSTANSGDNITFITFTVEDKADESVLAGVKKGTDSSTLKVYNDEDSQTLSLQGVKEGLACIMAVPKDVLNRYKDTDNSMSGEAFMKKVKCLFVSVKEGKGYTLNANGGRFIKSYIMEQYKNGVHADFAPIYDKGENEITIQAPKKCTWDELWEFVSRGLFKSGCEPFRYGCSLDDVYNLFSHSGEAEKTDITWKYRSISNVPENLDTIWLAYQKNENCKTKFTSENSTVTWADDVPAESTDGGKTWYYTAPENARFVFPAAERDGFVFLGWERYDSGSAAYIPAGSVGVIGSADGYRAVFAERRDKLEFDGNIPEEITEEDKESAWCYSFIGTDEDGITIYNMQIRESTELDDNGDPVSPVVEQFSMDEGHVYYLMIKVECDGYVDLETTEIIINGKLASEYGIQILGGRDKGYFYMTKKYVVGSAGEVHKLSFDNGAMGRLPDYVKNGITYVNGDTLEYILGEDKVSELYDMTYKDSTSGKIYKVRWYKSRAFRQEEEILRTTKLTGTQDMTLYADWVEQKTIGSAEIKAAVPNPGMYLNAISDYVSEGEVYKFSWMSGSNSEMSWECTGIYADSGLEEKVANKTEFKSGKTYYAKLAFTENQAEGYSFDTADLPVITVNGQSVQMKYEKCMNGWYDVYYEYSVVFRFTPITKTYSLTLDYNYPDNTKKTHTITDIPMGTKLKDGAFSLVDAMYMGDMTYDRYLYLVGQYESLGGSEFYQTYPYIDPDEKTGYLSYGYGSVRAYSSMNEAQGDSISLYYKTMTEDTTLYVIWKKELDSILLKSIHVPECGSLLSSYYELADYGVEFEDGVNSANYKWMSSDLEDLDYSKTFTGGEKVMFHLQVRLGSEGTDALFDRYITENLKLRYNGKEYEGVKFKPGKFGDATVEFNIPVTVEHEFNKENGSVVKINEVETGCEMEGSYDEVRKYHCAGCDTDIDETLHRIVPPLGHDLSKRSVTDASGTTTYWECQRCHKLFSDENGKKDFTFPTDEQEPSDDPTPSDYPTPADYPSSTSNPVSADNTIAAQTPSGQSTSGEVASAGGKLLKKAGIKLSKKKIKYAKIKKKAQTVKIKITGSKGKISYSNVSASKLKKYVKISKKGRALKLKFKKKAKKGTYKIRVTVSAKGNYKKTKTVIKIKIS